MPTYIELKDLNPACIERNPENPREVFPLGPLQELEDSIDSRGVLVPLYVYEAQAPKKKSKKSDAIEECDKRYVLVDGERRWLCANKLGHDKVPAIVGPKPSDEDNIISMFHIHRVREQWQDMPTAHAVAKVSARTGKTGVKELAELTGLKEEQIKRYQFAVSLPAEYQRLIAENQMPLNFFYELKQNVLDALESKRPKLLAEIGREKIMQVFVDKKLTGVTTDSIELRLVRPIIQVAEREAKSTDAVSPLDSDLRKLLTDPKKNIRETYQDTVELTVEAGKFGKECDFLMKRFEWLKQKAATPEEFEPVREAAKQLVAQLKKGI